MTRAPNRYRKTRKKICLFGKCSFSNITLNNNASKNPVNDSFISYRDERTSSGRRVTLLLKTQNKISWNQYNFPYARNIRI